MSNLDGRPHVVHALLEAGDAPAFLSAMALLEGNEELAHFGIGHSVEFGGRVHWWFNFSEEGWRDMRAAVESDKDANAALAKVALESIHDMAARVRSGAEATPRRS